MFDRPVELQPGTTAADVEGWDSVAHVILILATESEFGVRFDSNEILNAGDVGQLVDMIAAKMDRGA